MNQQGNGFDPTLFATFVALSGIWIADVALYFAIPRFPHRLKVFIFSNFVVWAIINISIYLAVTPRSAGLDAILLANLIMVVLIIIGSIYIVNFRQLEKLGFLPKPITPSLDFGLSNVDKVIMPSYVKKRNVILNDKQDAMSAILRQISLTTVPTTLENLARIALFEVRPNGYFRILAAHHIDAHRIPYLERVFKYGDNPVGTVGLAATEKRTILVSDLTDISARSDGKWEPTPENNLPGQNAASIICVPVIDPSYGCLAVISASCSKRNYFTMQHQEELQRYAEKIRILLLALNSHILFDPEVSYRIRAITISGEAGSGKSTLVAELKDILQPAGWRTVSVGQMFRRFCEENGVNDRDIAQLPDDIHRKFDKYQQLMLIQDDKLIVEGRLSGYLAKDITDVLRIYCKLPLEERIARVAERSNISIEEARHEVTIRDRDDLNKYKELYGIDDYRKGDFYFYLKTDKPPSILAQQAIEEVIKTIR